MEMIAQGEDFKLIRPIIAFQPSHKPVGKDTITLSGSHDLLTVHSGPERATVYDVIPELPASVLCMTGPSGGCGGGAPVEGVALPIELSESSVSCSLSVKASLILTRSAAKSSSFTIIADLTV
jgi:hypothetical protein